MMFPENVNMYRLRLHGLQLTQFTMGTEQLGEGKDERGEWVDYATTTTTRLTRFGEMFAAACIPADWEFARGRSAT
jgi:hypothetical protein